MHKKSGLFLTHSLLATVLFAQNTGEIRGSARDTETGEPLIGVNIILDGTRLGAATNLQGDYFIEDVPTGTHRLIARMVGYRVRIVRQV